MYHRFAVTTVKRPKGICSDLIFKQDHIFSPNIYLSLNVSVEMRLWHRVYKARNQVFECEFGFSRSVPVHHQVEDHQTALTYESKTHSRPIRFQSFFGLRVNL